MKIKLFVSILCIVAVVGVLSGCGKSGDSAQSSDANSTVVVLSPHDHAIKTEFENAFKKAHPEITLQWIDQGGSSDAVRFIVSQFKSKTNKDDGIGIDVFFGGGLEPYVELQENEMLQPLTGDSKLPAALNGVPLRGPKNEWAGAALSGFGILYNKQVTTRDRLPVPVVWRDLGNPALKGKVELADPRKSGSAHTAYEIVLQTDGWDNGWKSLLGMAANARAFIDSSSQLVNDVSSGEAVFVPAIDFYARAKMAEAGADKIGYVEPKGQSVVTPDPIAILRGAKDQEAAQTFVEFVLSPAAQKLWLLPKGAPGGPQFESLFRQPILPELYKNLPKDSLIKTNPFESKNSRPYDYKKATLRRKVLDDLIGAVVIDNLDLLKAHAGNVPAFVPVTESEIAALAAKWDDPVLRQKKLGEWREAARKALS